MPNQNPEQLARDRIDAALLQAGWLVQHKQHLNLGAGVGVAIREYQTDIGPVGINGLKETNVQYQASITKLMFQMQPFHSFQSNNNKNKLFRK